MRKMAKKILSIMLTIALLGSFADFRVFAQEDQELSVESDTADTEVEADVSDAVDNRNYNGHIYMIFDLGYEWYDAEEYCESLGGHLVTVTSAGEQKIVQELLASGEKNSYWLGGIKKNGTWTWTTGETFLYSCWAMRQPDNYTGSEFGLMAYRNSNPGSASSLGEWNDLDLDGTCRNQSFFGLENFGFICEWDSDTLIEYDKELTSNSIIVYENKVKDPNKTMKYQLSKGTSISINKNGSSNGSDTADYVTKKDGVITVENSSWKSATFSKEGYSTRTISKKRIRKSKKVYLQPSSSKPVINALWLDNTDVTNESYEVDLLETDSVTLEAEIDWGDSSCERIELAQDGKKVAFSGNTLTMVLKDKFDVSKTIYLRAIDKAGNVTARALKIESGGGVADSLDGLKFSINSKIDLTLPDSLPLIGGGKVGLDVIGLLPISVATEGNKVYATIGLDLVNYSKKDGKSETKYAWQNIKAAASMTDRKETLKKLKNIKSTYANSTKKLTGSFGVDADFTVLGYLEGYIDSDGNFNLLDGKVIFNPSISWDGSGQFFIGPVPCYWETQIKGELEAKFNVYRSSAAKTFMPAGDATVTVSGSIGAGVGINKVATIGGGGTLKFKPYAVFSSSNPYFSLTTSINLYFKVKVGLFEYKNDSDSLKEWFIDSMGTKTSKAVLDDVDTFDYTDDDAYTVQDLSYLDAGSEFCANGTSALKSRSADEGIFKTNTYSESDPKIASFQDGTKLAVWIDSDNSEINDIALYYSYYDGSTWSIPQVISQDNTVDYEPELTIIDDVAYVIWQNGTTGFDTDATLESVAENMEITAAVFDRTSQSFSVMDVSGNQEGLPLQPTICGADGRIAAVWINNRGYDWFGTNQENDICVSYYDGTTWSEPETLYENLGSILSLSAAYVNGGLNIVYCEDTDNDLSTTEDLQIVLNGDVISETQDATLVSASQILGESLYWYQDGAIMCLEHLSDDNASAIIEEGTLSSDEYQIITDGEQKVIVCPVSDELTRELYGIFYDTDSNQWGEPTALTELGGYISTFSGLWTEDGLQILADRQEVTGTYEDEQPYGEADLRLLQIEEGSDLSIEDVTVDESTIVANGASAFTTTVKNNGTSAATCKINVLSEDGTILGTMEYGDSILPGEEKELEYLYMIPEELVGKTVTFQVVSTQEGDMERSGKSMDITLDYDDISLEDVGWGEDENGEATIYASVANEGYHTASDIQVSLLEDSEDGETVDSMTLESLESLDSRAVSFTVPYEADKVYYLKVSGVESDSNDSNNVDYVVLNDSMFEQDIEDKTAGETTEETDETVETDQTVETDRTEETNQTNETDRTVENSQTKETNKTNQTGSSTKITTITKKTISKLKITAKKNTKKITVKTMKNAKVKIILNKKILVKGKKKVRSIVISPSRNKSGKLVFKLSKKLPKYTVIKVVVSKAGYETKRKMMVIM